MCFRPAGVAKPVECPNCHKKVTPIAGVLPKECPFCSWSNPPGKAPKK